MPAMALCKQHSPHFTTYVSAGSWIRRGPSTRNADYPARIVVISYLLGLAFHLDNCHAPLAFASFGVGVYHASASDATPRGAIIYARHRDASIGFTMGCGLRLRADAGFGIILFSRYHNIQFD
jgi:hypothetical protein